MKHYGHLQVRDLLRIEARMMTKLEFTFGPLLDNGACYISLTTKILLNTTIGGFHDDK